MIFILDDNDLGLLDDCPSDKLEKLLIDYVKYRAGRKKSFLPCLSFNDWLIYSDSN